MLTRRAKAYSSSGLVV